MPVSVLSSFLHCPYSGFQDSAVLDAAAHLRNKSRYPNCLHNRSQSLIPTTVGSTLHWDLFLSFFFSELSCPMEKFVLVIQVKQSNLSKKMCGMLLEAGSYPLKHMLESLISLQSLRIRPPDFSSLFQRMYPCTSGCSRVIFVSYLSLS